MEFDRLMGGAVRSPSKVMVDSPIQNRGGGTGNIVVIPVRPFTINRASVDMATDPSMPMPALPPMGGQPPPMGQPGMDQIPQPQMPPPGMGGPPPGMGGPPPGMGGPPSMDQIPFGQGQPQMYQMMTPPPPGMQVQGMPSMPTGGPPGGGGVDPNSYFLNLLKQAAMRGRNGAL